MIQKGIIAQVIDKYTYKIRIPKYDKIEAATASTKTDDLSNGIVCAMPGVDVSYVLGDIVLVSFENGELSKPIILGLLYREQKSDSDISLTNVDNSLSDIQNNLQKINSSGLYTHIRYSNDNGLTFTSLFSDSNHETIIDGEVVCQPLYDDSEVAGINIDKATRVISWSIIDSNNVDVTDGIGIEITVFDSNGNIIKKERNTDHQRSFTINNSSKITGDLYFTYKLFVTKEYLDTLSVMITTDKAPFGVPTGEYVGVYVSNNSRASINPSDYSWFQSSAGGDIDTEINNKIARLSAEFDIKLENLKDEVDENFVTIYYKSVEWTQAEVDVYCQTGYEGTWSRDMSAGYTGEIKTGNVLYITVHNTGTSSSSTDDSYGQLEIRALADAAAGESVQGVVLSYLVSAEIALDALARFKSSLLEPGDETLVYGGHITTGRISDSSGKNFIQLSAENGTPAGQMEFKDQSSWALSNQGIQWDSGHGQLNVKGHVQANSLTIIGNDGVAYNGTDAINISGYELTLEVVDIDGSYCYVYPHLLLNGEEVTGIVSASLPLDTINKIYYTRSGSAPHYDYTVVSDPVDSSVASYYESTIDYSRFIWYRNNSSIGEVGDNTHEGRIRAAYTDTLRCTYSFAEGGTGGAQSAVTVEVDPSRYITRNSATDINIHPESYQNTSSYIQLNNNGLHVFNSSGDSIANYGSITTIGKTDGSQSYLKLDYHSMQAIDKEGDYYFYVSDLRNADGFAEMSETMSTVYSSSTTITCYTTLIAYDWENEMEVYADGVLLTPVTGYTYNPSPTWREISIYKSEYPDVTRDSTIVVNYKTIDQQAKAYTLGLRDSTDTVGVMSIAMGLDTVASGYCSLAWGKGSKAFGKYSCALGERCKAWKMGSYAEGCATEAGYTAHAEGVNTRATGMYSHAQGSQSKATGQCAHAEGEYTQATGPRAHAEGSHTLASDADSHAGGWYSEASGDSAFAHGSYANAQGDQASAFGRYTLASSDNQFVIGKYNVEDTSSTYAFIIGKGTNTSGRSNAMQVDWNGKTTIASTLVQNSDRRLKEHIDYLDEDAVNFIRGLKPAHYIKDEENQLGFYAQDVEKIDTWNALIGEMNGYKTLSYTELIAPLVAYCQHLEKRIEELENK